MIGARTVANAMDEKDELPARAAPGDGTKGRSAFVQSVDQIINISDLANLKPVLRRGVAQHLSLIHI